MFPVSSHLSEKWKQQALCSTASHGLMKRLPESLEAGRQIAIDLKSTSSLSWWMIFPSPLQGTVPIANVSKCHSWQSWHCKFTRMMTEWNFLTFLLQPAAPPENSSLYSVDPQEYHGICKAGRRTKTSHGSLCTSRRKLRTECTEYWVLFNWMQWVGAMEPFH